MGSAANDSVEEEQPAQIRYPVRNRRPPCPYPGTIVGEKAFDDIDLALAAYGDYIPESLSAALRGLDADHCVTKCWQINVRVEDSAARPATAMPISRNNSG